MHHMSIVCVHAFLYKLVALMMGETQQGLSVEFDGVNSVV